MSDFDPYEEEAPRGLQPGTKLVFGLLAGCLALGVLMIVAALASRPVDEAAAPPPVEPSAPSFRQPRPAPLPDVPVAPAVTGLALGTLLLALIVAGVASYVVLTILLLAWVARDARCRGLDSGPWVIALLMAQVAGFLVYLASRPHGPLSTCANCGNKKLSAARRCPHCGQAVRRY